MFYKAEKPEHTYKDYWLDIQRLRPVKLAQDRRRERRMRDSRDVTWLSGYGPILLLIIEGHESMKRVEKGLTFAGVTFVSLKTGVQSRTFLTLWTKAYTPALLHAEPAGQTKTRWEWIASLTLIGKHYCLLLLSGLHFDSTSLTTRCSVLFPIQLRWSLNPFICTLRGVCRSAL